MLQSMESQRVRMTEQLNRQRNWERQIEVEELAQVTGQKREQRMTWLDGITDSADMSLGKL